MSTPYPLDITGPAAPPRRNGELVFAEPWESRAFGLAFTLADRGVFGWDEFQSALIAAVREEEQAPEWSYYRAWLRALERLTAERGLVTPAEVADRASILAERQHH